MYAEPHRLQVMQIVETNTRLPANQVLKVTTAVLPARHKHQP
jgi:hypothetical protein